MKKSAEFVAKILGKVRIPLLRVDDPRTVLDIEGQ